MLVQPLKLFTSMIWKLESIFNASVPDQMGTQTTS